MLKNILILVLSLYVLCSCGSQENKKSNVDITVLEKDSNSNLIKKDLSCHEQLKHKILNGIFFSDIKDTDIDDKAPYYNNKFQSNTPTKTKYTRYYNIANKVFSDLEVEHVFKIGNSVFELEYTLNYDSLTLKVEHRLGTEKVEDLIQTLSISPNCTLSFHQNQRYQYHYNIDDHVEISYDSYYHDKSTQHKARCVESQYLKELDEDKIVQDLSKGKPFTSKMYFDFDQPISEVSLNLDDNEAECYDPVLAKRCSFTKISCCYKFSTCSSLNYQMLVSKNSCYSCCSMPSLKIKSESVNKAIWLATNIKNDSTLSLSAHNFYNSDLLSDRTYYEVESLSPLTFENNNQYFDILKSRKEEKPNNTVYKYLVRGKKLDPSTFKHVSIETTNNEDDSQYLKASDYIDLNHPDIRKIANQLLKGFNGTRWEMVKKILKFVSSYLHYDYDMIKNNTTDLLKVDEVLRRKKGVCQHYSLLFVTLARALKIPARFVVGFNFSEAGKNDHYTTTDGHSWVEVKINNTDWIPLEPQHGRDALLPAFSYFPLGIQKTYETVSGIGETFNQLQIYVAHIKLTKINDFETLKKYDEQFAYFNRATTNRRAKKFEAQAQDLKKTVSTHTPSKQRNRVQALANFKIGYNFYIKEQYKEAIKYFTDAIDADNSYTISFYFVGLSFFRLDQHKIAKAAISEYIRLEPEDPDGYYIRGQMYQELNSYDNAVKDYSSVLKLCPKHPGAKKMLDKITGKNK